jgi:translation initiation factor IF-3
VNAAIRAPQIRVIDEDGNQLGLMTPDEAIKAAVKAELDLVEVAPTAKPPVCRIMDFSRFKYDQAKKEKEARKKQKVIHIKEIKFHPRIEEHDYEFKKNHAEKFLKRGDKVKATMVYRGRENINQEQGLKVLARLAEALAPIAEIESEPKRDRNQMIMMLAPKRG